MKILVLGAGMMGRAIAYDLSRFSDADDIVLGEKDRKTRLSADRFLQGADVTLLTMDAENLSTAKRLLHKGDILVSALPYIYNDRLAQLAIQNATVSLHALHDDSDPYLWRWHRCSCTTTAHPSISHCKK